MKMFDIISKFCLEIVYEISDYINYYTEDLEDFTSDRYKNSDVKEVLKEEYLRVKLFNKLQTNFENKIVKSGLQLIRWNRFLVEKEYPSNPNLFCDIFMQGNTANHNNYSARYVYEKENKKDLWIELKFFTPTNSGSAHNRGLIINDFLRLYYLLKGYRVQDWHIDRYFIIFLLCGKYKIDMNISNFFGGDNRFLELFFPNDLNITQHHVFNIKECISENLQFKNFKRGLSTDILNIIQNEITIDLMYIDRKYIIPFPFFTTDLSFSDMNRSLFGYIFRIKGYREIKHEE